MGEKNWHKRYGKASLKGWHSNCCNLKVEENPVMGRAFHEERIAYAQSLKPERLECVLGTKGGPVACSQRMSWSVLGEEIGEDHSAR